MEVIACGLCHTDLGYADASVPTKKGIPIVLGHEAVGRVVAAGKNFESLVGSTVLVPAVLPCGECPFCLAGRGNACPNQKMPGNDINGGFSTHFLVPARPLIKIGAGFSSNVAALSVVAVRFQPVLRKKSICKVPQAEIVLKIMCLPLHDSRLACGSVTRTVAVLLCFVSVLLHLSIWKYNLSRGFFGVTRSPIIEVM